MLVLLAIFFFAYQFIMRIMFGVMSMDIITLNSLELDFIGKMASAYYIAYSISNLITAIIFTQFNFLLIASLGSAMMALGIIPFMLKVPVYYLLIGRVLIGIGSGMGIPFLMQSIFIMYKDNIRNTLINTGLMLGLLGLSFAIYILKPMYGVSIDYFLTIKSLFVISILISISIFIAYLYVHLPNQQNVFFIRDVFEFLFNKKIILLGLIGTLFIGGLEGFADLWAAYFFEDCFNIPNIEIAISVFWISLAVGGPVLQFLYSLMPKTHGLVFVIYIGLVKLLIFIGLLYYASVHNIISIYAIIVFMFVLGVCSAYQAFLFTLVPNIVGEKYSMLGITLLNAMFMGFGQFFHIFIAESINVTGRSTEGYIQALSIIPICYIVGIFIILVCNSYIYKNQN